MVEIIDKLDARAIIASIVVLGFFIEFPIVMLIAFQHLTIDVALEFLKTVLLIYNTAMGFVLGYYFGGKNGEKREEIRTKALLQASGVIPPNSTTQVHRA